MLQRYIETVTWSAPCFRTGYAPMQSLYAPPGASLSARPKALYPFVPAPGPALLPPHVHRFSVAIPPEAAVVGPEGGLRVSIPEDLRTAVPQRQVQFVAGRYC